VALAVVNDVSARNLQENITPGLGKNWILGKAQESFLQFLHGFINGMALT
jgi:hypothetical protein